MTSSVAAAEVHGVQRGEVVLLRGSLAASPRINVRARQASHRVTLCLCNCMAHFAQGNLTSLDKVALCLPTIMTT
jgi:hypothetical protein